jgi:hypothetical protein
MNFYFVILSAAKDLVAIATDCSLEWHEVLRSAQDDKTGWHHLDFNSW